MNVYVMVDTDSETVDESRFGVIISEADSILQGLAGIHLNLIGYQEISLAGKNLYQHVYDIVDRNSEMFQDVHYLIVFSFGDNMFARSYGGYSFTIPMRRPYRNPFKTPALDDGDGHIYGSVIHFSHRYAACGYAQSGDEEPISEYSIDGQCRNTPGLKCVERFGYQMCPNLINDLNASTETYMASSTIVHEVGHPFGYHGAYDHLGAPNCVEEDPRGGFTNLERSDELLAMCPYVWDNLRASFQGYE